MTTWVLPDHVADVLPSQARQIEDMRRRLLDAARGYGYELVMPPLAEHTEALLTGTGQTLDLMTFKLVDQLSGRSLGIRADTTPQVARIDAHLLNREGVTRLCYCGPVLHTRPEAANASREPLQFGCELFGHAGIEADMEVLNLALDAMRLAHVGPLLVTLSDVTVLRSQLAGQMVAPEQLEGIHQALAHKDSAKMLACTEGLPAAVRENLRRLLSLYGGISVIDAADDALKPGAMLAKALERLKQIAAALPADVDVAVDLADVRGYGYYSGTRFEIVAKNAQTSVARGGRYDEVGAVFGRSRAAVGFSCDLKALADIAPLPPIKKAISAAWMQDAALQDAVRALRAQGEVVVCQLPGHEGQWQEFECDRQLLLDAGQWRVVPLV